MHTKPWVRARASKEYWEKMKPAGDKRTRSNLFPGGGWGVTKRGDRVGAVLGILFTTSHDHCNALVFQLQVGVHSVQPLFIPLFMP